MSQKSSKIKEISIQNYEKTRNIPNYLDKIKLKSKGTIKNQIQYLKRFDRYLDDIYDKTNETVLDEIISMPQGQQQRVLFDVLQDFVNDLSGKKNKLNSNPISAGYIRHTVHAIKGYLRFYGFKITSEDIKDNLTLPRVIEEEREPLQRSQLQLILNNSTGLRRIMYLVMSSSGMRPSEVMMIRKRDLELEKYERIMVRLPAKITKTKKPRITFISKEAQKELVSYLKRINDDAFVFNSDNKTMEQIRLNEEQIFGRLREKIGLLEKYESGIHKVSLGDSLRSWFITKCNRIDHGFGHALAGHELYMKRYDGLTLDEKLELYIKSEKLLQAFEYVDEDQQKQMEQLEEKIKQQDDIIKQQESDIRKIKDDILQKGMSEQLELDSDMEKLIPKIIKKGDIHTHMQYIQNFIQNNKINDDILRRGDDSQKEKALQNRERYNKAIQVLTEDMIKLSATITE